MSDNSRFPIVALILPAYNEEAVIAHTIEVLDAKLKMLIAAGAIHSGSHLLFVDDCSKDSTLSILRSLASPSVRTIKLAGNVGHQNALLAGMHYCTGKVDCIISMDADLQDDVNVIDEMIENFRKGAHIVYGVRQDRSTDTHYKKGTALFFYKLMNWMGVQLVYNHADFRLLSNTVLRELQKYREVNLFLRGLFPKMGFKSAFVYYDRQSRKAGESKYPFRKMLALAVNGITSFTSWPLKLITWMGVIVFAISLVLSLWVLYVVIRHDNTPGWASITLPIYFLGGIQLLAIGILGEYIAKIYLETKQRPPYHIEETIAPVNEAT